MIKMAVSQENTLNHQAILLAKYQYRFNVEIPKETDPCCPF